jgi:hypothetical protein
MIYTYLYRVLGLAWCVVLAMNIQKHGWHPVTVATGLPLAVLLLSLGVAPERRAAGWDVRYVITAVVVAAMAATFLRFPH